MANLTRSQPLQRRMRRRRCERGRVWRRGRQSRSSQAANVRPRLEMDFYFYPYLDFYKRRCSGASSFVEIQIRALLTYHGDNLILSRSRLLLQPLFLIHLRVGAHSEVKTLTFFRNANPPIELLPKGPLLGNCQALSKCQNLSLISLLYHQIP